MHSVVAVDARALEAEDDIDESDAHRGLCAPQSMHVRFQPGLTVRPGIVATLSSDRAEILASASWSSRAPFVLLLRAENGRAPLLETGLGAAAAPTALSGIV